MEDEIFTVYFKNNSLSCVVLAEWHAFGVSSNSFGVPSILSDAAFTSAEKCLVEAILTVPE